MSTNHIPGFVPSMLLNAETLLGSKPTGLSPLEAELLTRALDAVIPVMHTPPDDHEQMVEREIERQDELMAGLTREDAEIMAHDRLNPGFGLTLAAEASLYADRRDHVQMRRCSELGRGPHYMRPAQRLYHIAGEFGGEFHTPPETAYSGALTQAPAEHYAGGPDGPIREPGDTVPTRSDIYTDDELCASLDLHAARAAKRGDYGAAADLGLARDALATRADEVEQASVVVHKLLTKLEFLGYATCAESPRCLLAHEHPGGCVFSHEEAARMRKNDAEADDHE
jgi:hypothetical protein